MKKYLLAVVSLFIAGFMLLPMVAKAQGNPIDMLQSVANRMIDSLKENKTTLKENPSLVYSLATRIIVPHADLDEMSKRVLPPQTWNSASSGQRHEFEQEFTTLLVRTYATALAQYKDQTVKFFPVRGGYEGRSTVRVSSQIIRTDGPAISVSYSLVSRGGEWRLYDMTVEGVSMLESFRSQFADQLSRGDMANLIRVLKEHNASNAGSGD